eukprot:s2549_g8.t1
MSGHHFFCAEWRRLRKVVPIEEDLLYEFVFAAPSWEHVLVDSSLLEASRTSSITSEKLSRVMEREVHAEGAPSAGSVHQLAEDRHPGRKAPDAAVVPHRRGGSPGHPPCDQFHRFHKALRGTESGPLTSTPELVQLWPMLFKNPLHPLANLPESLGAASHRQSHQCRTEFVIEIRKRLHAANLFHSDAQNVEHPGGECEDLFEVLLQLSDALCV